MFLQVYLDTRDLWYESIRIYFISSLNVEQRSDLDLKVLKSTSMWNRWFGHFAETQETFVWEEAFFLLLTQ